MIQVSKFRQVAFQLIQEEPSNSESWLMMQLVALKKLTSRSERYSGGGSLAM